MISWSFLRGILVTVLFMFNLNTDRAALGSIALCTLIILAAIEMGQRKPRHPVS